MMTTGNGQITSSLTVVVLDEEVGTMAHQELHTPEVAHSELVQCNGNFLMLL